MNTLPTYDEAVALTLLPESPFYETVKYIDNFKISLFNYRLAQNKDFIDKKNRELRGLTFVFNTDGSLFKRYILLEKFFNLNQVEWSMYSVVKDYKIKSVNNKEDGSIASFIKLPNGRVLGKSKMSFDSEQAVEISKIYETNNDIKRFVDYSFEKDFTIILEYVSPQNRIVLEYTKEELILLKLRDNKTGKLLDISNYSDKLGSVKVAESEAILDLDTLIEIIKTQEDKEGFVILTEDNDGNDFSYKMKNKWYCGLHSVLTESIYMENLLIGLILDDKIDDVLGQIEERDVFAHDRVNNIIKIIKKSIDDKVIDIERLNEKYKELNSRKEFAIKYIKDENFSCVMSMVNRDSDSYDIAKEWLRRKTNKLMTARDWLKEKEGETLL